MAERQYDVAIIGAGPGGYVAAIRAAQNGLSVGLVERDRLGGVCLNWGCIPTKALIRSAELYASFKRSAEFGISHSNLSYDFSRIISRSRGISERISRGIEYLMKKNKIDVIRGTAKLTGINSLEVTDIGGATETIRAKNIILASGGRPRSIPGVVIDRKKIITSTEAMTLAEQPASMVILGGGAIGIEFAYFYNAFGTKVTIVEMMPNILPLEDRENVRMVESSLKKSGIEILTGTKVESVLAGDEVTIVVSDEKGTKELKASVALAAIGVQANTENLGLDTAGVKVEKGFIRTDEFCKTNVDGMYAIGDVAGPPLLAHVASHEGLVAADHIAGRTVHGIDRSSIPCCTYCQPQVASVGMTEEAALAQGYKIKIGRFPFRPLGKAMALGESEGAVKLIFDEKDGTLIGAHIVGSEATEMIAELVMAKSLGATWRDLHCAMHAHPTLSEAVMEAAGQAYGEAIHI
jgi:dihydrolipoamide dehydrogenase